MSCEVCVMHCNLKIGHWQIKVVYFKRFHAKKNGAKTHGHIFSSFAPLRGASLRLCVEVLNAYINDIDLYIMKFLVLAFCLSFYLLSFVLLFNFPIHLR